jgi:ABC-2 type transport system permease protein
MINTTHVRYDILRMYRVPTTVALTIALPLVVYYAVTPGNRHAHPEGITFALYFMTGMAAYGAMWAAVFPGAHVARDRASGWTRHTRTTPLRTGTYFVSKVLTSYLVAIPTLVLLGLAGASLFCSTWPAHRSGYGSMPRGGWRWPGCFSSAWHRLL